MKAVGKELKWALCGFIGGFVLCYILVGALMPAQPTRVQVAQSVTFIPASSNSVRKVVIRSNKTNAALQAVRVPTYRTRWSPPSPELRNVPRGTVPDTYSTDLIDGRDLGRKP